ncbi:hypothetical protein FQR65_LT20498 [Abscondita terminalis]|nr:hypothetical protein FQR65_LT20498 [Abscondita terminalis]
MSRVSLTTGLAGVVGARTAKALERAFEIETVEDLLMHVPRRYSRRGELTPLSGLPLGEQITVVAQVLDTRERQMQRRRGKIIEARITDGTGTLTLTFFNQPRRSQELLPGRRGTFAGKVSAYRGQLQLQHPDYELFEHRDDAPGGERLDEAAAKAWAETPVPIYPATAQFTSWKLQRTIAIVLDALALAPPLDDPLPEAVRAAEGIMPLAQAFELVHRPQRDADWRAAQQSLRFREAFELQLALVNRRRRAGKAPGTPRPVGTGSTNAGPTNTDPLTAFDAALPFELTGDQRRAAETISAELAEPHPMHRLLQGEVGSGKTLVALRAMLQVAATGGQSALLAPTEVLAAQHLRSFTEMLGPDLTAQLNPVLLTGKMPVSERKRALLSLASGTASIAVGTHALISENVSFYDLGFIVVDEQHRFGVEQREALRQKGSQPHVLAMTATPIPRTVALTTFGDLEVTTIRELPPGRQGIDTFVVPELELPRRAARVWQRAAEEIAKGRQVYVVCPAISQGRGEEEAGGGAAAPEEAAHTRPLANVVDTTAELRARPEFAAARIEALDGGMSADDKNRIMSAFARGEIDVLVATTVIEVGVNVPNAGVMIVRDADRFGISQLHQLRGRVGRGQHPGLCLLMTTAEQGSPARERIEAVAATSDGFALAEVDLELRREGDILGTVQSGGRSTLRLLRVVPHGELIAHAREVAEAVLDRDPELRQASVQVDQGCGDTCGLGSADREAARYPGTSDFGPGGGSTRQLRGLSVGVPPHAVHGAGDYFSVGDTMIEARGLTKQYGTKTAVNDVSFSIKPGQVTGFLGPNGAGKSTTMRLVLGLDRPSAGTVTVNGQRYADFSAPLSEVGALLDAKGVHPGRSARGHLRAIAATHNISDRRVDEVLEQTGLTGVAGKRVGGFSLGMGQRLGIAAALLGDPRVLILDEPINGLDPDGVVWVRHLLRHLAGEGRSVLVSSHLMSEMAQTADHVIVLGRGRVVADAPIAEFIAGAGEDRVFVRSPEAVRFAAIMLAETHDEATLEVTDSECFVTRGFSAPEIGELAAKHGVPLHELRPERVSLEEAYIALTRDQLEYAAA